MYSNEANIGINMKEIDLIGKTFGKLTVINKSFTKKKRIHWRCKCECGKEKDVDSGHLRYDRTRSCGCAQYDYGKNNRSWKGFEEIPMSYFERVKCNAKSRNVLFTLKIKDLWDLFIRQNKKCALSGLPLDFTYGGRDKKHRGTASLDRIDATKGYIESNVQWVHKDINWMKQDYSNNYFLEMCQKICDFQKSEA